MPSFGEAELLIGMVQAFGAPRPPSNGRSELYEDLVQAIGTFVATPPPLPPTTRGIFTPYQFGAVGDGVHDDTAAVAAAIAAASPGGTSPAIGQGGIVYFPPGVYACSAALFYYPNTIWQGAGVSASQIKLTTDLWPGGSAAAAAFISAAGGLSGPGQAQGKNWLMRDIAVQGPGAATLGQVTCHTNGIQGNHSGFILENLHIEGFYAGIETVGDHNKFFNIYSTRNYYGVDYSDHIQSSGNDAYFACLFSGNNLAGFHVGGPNVIQTTTMTQMHLGYSPLGIFKTDSQNGWDGNGNPVYTGGTVATQAAVQECILDGVSFEAVGNAAILDLSTQGGGSTLMAGTVLRCDAFTWNGSFLTTNAPLSASTDYQGAWALYLKSASGHAFINPNPFTAGSVGVVKFSGIPPSFHFGVNNALVPVNFFGSGTNFAPISQGQGVGHSIQSTLYGLFGTSNPQAMGDLVSVIAITLINVGDVVEMSSSIRIQRATGTKPVFGIAMTPSPGTTAVPVMVMTNGYCQVNQTAATASGSPVYLDATTTYMINGTNTAGKLVGISTNGAGSTATPTLLRFLA